MESSPAVPRMVYKICPRALWEAARSAGSFRGSEDDQRDGFIHFSTAEQLPGTLRKHFEGQQDLVLLELPSVNLGGQLVMEPSSAGVHFPHFYGCFSIAAVAREWSLSDGLPNLK